jgi:hypothetical protein
MATDSVKTPLLAETIEPDDPTPAVHGTIGSTPATTATVSKLAPVVLTPTTRATPNANATPAQLESGELATWSCSPSVCSADGPSLRRFGWYLAAGEFSSPHLSTVVSHLRVQSSHPVALLFLYLFRTGAIAVYVLCGWFTDNYVLSVRCATKA